MSERVLISHDKDVDLAALRAALRSAGAASVAPIESLPDTLLANVDAGDADAFVASASALAGVRNAERDRMRYSS
jgi:hypothetical protein